MAAPRKYSDDTIAHALKLYQDEGLAHAARVTGIPKGTIASLAHRNGMQTYALPKMEEAVATRAVETRLKLETIKANWADVTLHMQARAVEEEHAKDAYSCTLSGAIATDKLLLMSGEATSRHETRGDLDHAIIAELVRAERIAREQEPALSDGQIKQPDAIEVQSHTE